MKLLIKISLFILLIKNTNAQAILTGRILNHTDEKCFVLEPINGFYNDVLFLPEFEMKISNTGQFTHQLNLTQNGVVKLFVGLRPFWFYIEPKDTVTIELNMLLLKEYELNDALKIEGNNCEGNLLFNKINYQQGKKLGMFENYLDSFKFYETNDLDAIAKALAKSLHPFISLQSTKKLTRGFEDNIIAGLRGVLINRIPRQILYNPNKKNEKNRLDLLKRIYTKFKPTLTVLESSPFNNTIASYYYQTMACADFPTADLDDSLIYIKKEKRTINKNLVQWLYAPKQIQEMHWAFSLIRLKHLFADSYNKNDVEAFIALHPNSIMEKYLTSPYFGNEDELTQQIDSSKIHLLDTSKFISFADIKNYFTGKPLLIDLWATWCVPCKQEFLLNKQIDSFCKINNIERLYLSIDMPVFAATYLKNIYAYNLKGYNLRANEILFKDIQRLFYANNPNEIEIPRYVLISAQGEIINDKVPPPSTGSKFYNTILQNLKTN